MEDADILESLLELASEAGLKVRVAGREPLSSEGPAVASGVCRLKGQLWVILSSGDPGAAQIRMLASALREHAADVIDGKHLPPAVRAVLDA